ncbi:MarR family winged helix-turn-helix transcriptional regulator [Candidatus Hydrogenosomobacter endosymbioticus]|uniref:HTH marR-type domain-containing protein n=1 Tax=Candidatus Hydrogenosomobacter endosymbioticus TaxID=2558174 RepID=A0ABM7V8Y5_9PROT|nr:winged helix DNA-binding protein [Candidatus Hydrogenosomobacter endosymbioticus]BDB95953.1 hypothetical protein HYD_0860 [Candidatus Hydrogenosomobacter endosymbioticus]
MKNFCMDSVMLFDRLHRLFLASIKKELSARNISDITPLQAIILYYINKKTVKISEISSNKFYLGSNVSYNVRKMLNNGYIKGRCAEEDRRVVHVALSQKGEKFKKQMDEIMENYASMFEKNGLGGDIMKDIASYADTMEWVLSKRGVW